MKKVLLSLGALAVALAVVPMFAAFEAHVINVTATIENALLVPVTPIKFGTVFPQEYLKKNLPIELSSSFMREGRVDDVKYFIRQKPKCAWSWQDATGVWHIDENSTQTGHVDVVNVGTQTAPEYKTHVNCGQPTKPLGVDLNAKWGELPSLCPYISKHGDTDIDPGESNDENMNSFHWTYQVDSNGILHWNDADGYLAKSVNDIKDNWVIDLAVPCFGGYCAQDWLKFVQDKSGNTHMTQEEANSYTQPIGNEHMVFGCDLWVEVTEVSEKPAPVPSPNG